MTKLQSAIDAPWRLSNEARRIASLPFMRLMFALHGITWGKHWRILGMPIVQRYRGSSIAIGNHVTLRSWQSSNPLSPNHPVVLATRTSTSQIVIGDHCGFTGTTLVAAESITIGDRVLVGANCTITDTDFHPLASAEREQNVAAGAHAPIVIQDNVFIGMNSLILKGVTLGHGCVVGAGSVVTRAVPPGAIAAGNPARVVGVVPAASETLRQRN